MGRTDKLSWLLSILFSALLLCFIVGVTMSFRAVGFSGSRITASLNCSYAIEVNEPSLQPPIPHIIVIEWKATRALGWQGMSLARPHSVRRYRTMSDSVLCDFVNNCSRATCVSSGNSSCIHYAKELMHVQ